MEEAICGEFGLIKAWKADKKGNLIFRYIPSGLKIFILSLCT
jgi:acyl CoA:acetate/3-ketoacid CoA transferase alpha subunit